MPSSAPQIPAAAIDAVVEPKLTPETGPLLGKLIRAHAHADLEAAYPHLLAAFKERLLSDEAVEAARLLVPDLVDAAALGGEKDALRTLFRAALASIESNGGAM